MTKNLDNRVAWAKSYFVQAKVLESPKRAHFKITERNRELLAQGHERIDVKILSQYSEFVEFHTPSKTNTPPAAPEDTTSETPEEILQKAYQSIRNDLAGEILDRIKSNFPSFFENLVVDLMVAMGYLGSRADARLQSRWFLLGCRPPLLRLIWPGGTIEFRSVGTVYDTLYFPDGLEIAVGRPAAAYKMELKDLFPGIENGQGLGITREHSTGELKFSSRKVAS